MTPSEFKCWFQGYTEALEGVPSETQWKRIKACVAEIDGRAITEHVYINRYVPGYYPNYYPNYYWGSGPILCNSGSSTSIGTGTTTMNLASATGGMLNASGANGNGATFDSHAAMLNLGRAEAQELHS